MNQWIGLLVFFIGLTPFVDLFSIPYIYVTNNDSLSGTLPGITVINPSTKSEVTTITDTSFNAPQGITLDPVSGLLYVANYQGGGGLPGITVVDSNTNQVVGRITDSSFNAPAASAFDPTTNYLFVLNSASTGSDPAITIIDPSNNSLVATITDSQFFKPVAIIYDSTTQHFYVLNDTANGFSPHQAILEINPVTYSVSATVSNTSFWFPNDIAIEPLTGYFYITNEFTVGGSNPGITVFNPSNNSVITTITDPSFSTPFGIALSPKGLFYVTNQGADSISVVSPPSPYTVTSFPSSNFHSPWNIIYDTKTSNFYVTNNGVTGSSVPGLCSIDPTNNNVIPITGHFYSPYGLVISNLTPKPPKKTVQGRQFFLETELISK